MTGAGRGWRLAAIAAAVFTTLDQATKQLAVASIERRESFDIFFGLELTYVRNDGVAFGAFGGGGPLVTALTVAPLVVLVGYFALHAGMPLLWLPVGVVVGGALGNLADRARDGSVIDFVDPVAWPAFNLADMGIVAGIFGLLYVLDWRRDRERGKAAS
jgi:signal peptidase II